MNVPTSPMIDDDDPCAGGTHCCCCGPGEPCCDCGQIMPGEPDDEMRECDGCDESHPVGVLEDGMCPACAEDHGG